MAGVTNLNQMLRHLDPILHPQELAFCTLPSDEDPEFEHCLAMFREEEGVTLVLPALVARESNYAFTGTYRRITLQVHSSLDAVGLTAAFSKALTEVGISANVIAAFYHDHIFVPSADAERAMQALIELRDTALS
ncbi:MAG: ACT domain-containing protein [Congregibacter sp.]